MIYDTGWMEPAYARHITEGIAKAVSTIRNKYSLDAVCLSWREQDEIFTLLNMTVFSERKWDDMLAIYLDSAGAIPSETYGNTMDITKYIAKKNFERKLLE